MRRRALGVQTSKEPGHRLETPSACPPPSHPANPDRQGAEEDEPGGGGPAIEEQGTDSREWSR